MFRPELYNKLSRKPLSKVSPHMSIPSADAICSVREDAHFRALFAEGLRVVDPTSVVDHDVLQLLLKL